MVFGQWVQIMAYLITKTTKQKQNREKFLPEGAKKKAKQKMKNIPKNLYKIKACDIPHHFRLLTNDIGIKNNKQILLGSWTKEFYSKKYTN